MANAENSARSAKRTHHTERSSKRSEPQMPYYKSNKLETFHIQLNEKPVLVIKAQENLPQADYNILGYGCSIRGCKLFIPGNLDYVNVAREYRNHNGAEHDDEWNIRLVMLWGIR